MTWKTLIVRVTGSYDGTYYGCLRRKIESAVSHYM